MENMKLGFTLERELKFERNKQIALGKIRIGGIRKIKGAYACSFLFPFDSEKERHIYGEDPIQALTLCLKTDRALIDSAAGATGMKIWWLDRRDHGGF
jgi:hypothetical protein